MGKKISLKDSKSKEYVPEQRNLIREIDSVIEDLQNLKCLMTQLRFYRIKDFRH
jgi:hypothetical protein